MRKMVSLAALVAVPFFFSDFGFTQTSKELNDLRRQIDGLKAGQTAIQKDLLDIKNLILQKELQGD